jgi:hypothetical protein
MSGRAPAVVRVEVGVQVKVASHADQAVGKGGDFKWLTRLWLIMPDRSCGREITVTDAQRSWESAAIGGTNSTSRRPGMGPSLGPWSLPRTSGTS